jgi:hypothetical protein
MAPLVIAQPILGETLGCLSLEVGSISGLSVSLAFALKFAILFLAIPT